MQRRQLVRLLGSALAVPLLPRSAGGCSSCLRSLTSSIGNIGTLQRRRPGGRRPPDVICQARTPPPGALRSRCHSFFVSGIGPRFGKELLDHVAAEGATLNAV